MQALARASSLRPYGGVYAHDPPRSQPVAPEQHRADPGRHRPPDRELRRAPCSLLTSPTPTRKHNPQVLTIARAINKKSKRISPRQRAQLVLVLDAIRTPGYLRNVVMDVFRTHYEDQARNLGYIAIWLVGPPAALTRQLS